MSLSISDCGACLSRRSLNREGDGETNVDCGATGISVAEDDACTDGGTADVNETGNCSSEERGGRNLGNLSVDGRG